MKKRKFFIYTIRFVLVFATIGVVCWIFSNSLKNAEESSSASGKVTAIIQSIIDTFTNSESNIVVNEYFIRKLAHFTEYAIYGLFLMFTCLSFTKKTISFIITVMLGVIVPITDELLQLTSDGRFCSFGDILIDICGTAVGVLVAIFIFKRVLLIIYNKKHKVIK